MRRDNTDIAGAEQQIRELEDVLRRDENALDSLNAELTEQHGEAGGCTRSRTTACLPKHLEVSAAVGIRL